MIKVLFFAQTRELVGVDQIELVTHYPTVEALRQQLSKQGRNWALALNADKLLVAVNQTICPMTTPIKDGDEIAFFPPVTGG